MWNLKIHSKHLHNHLIEVFFNLYDCTFNVVSNHFSTISQYLKSRTLTLFRTAGGSGVQKNPPTNFSPVASTNIGIRSKTFWSVVLILLPHWSKISRPYLVPVLSYWTWTKSSPEKKGFFWSNPYKTELVITSHRNVRVTKLWSPGHIYNVIWVTW